MYPGVDSSTSGRPLHIRTAAAQPSQSSSETRISVAVVGHTVSVVHASSLAAHSGWPPGLGWDRQGRMYIGPANKATHLLAIKMADTPFFFGGSRLVARTRRDGMRPSDTTVCRSRRPPQHFLHGNCSGIIGATAAWRGGAGRCNGLESVAAVAVFR